MIPNELFNKEVIGFDAWAVTPNINDVIPEDIRREERVSEFSRKLSMGSRNPNITITHGDADGLTSATLVEFFVDGDCVIETVSYGGAFGLKEAMSTISNSGIQNANIFITDFKPDSMAAVEPMKVLTRKRNCSVQWFDHHQWEEEYLQEYSKAGAEITIDDSGNECAASLLFKKLPVSFPSPYGELVEVTRDRDLWINEDERGKDLGTYAEIAEIGEYVEVVKEYGPDLPEFALDHVREEQETNERLKEFAVENVEGYSLPNYEVGITYISGGVSSEIGNELVENDEYDIAVVLFPSGGAGIYSHSDREGFDKCHKVGERFDGGGHPTAGGFMFDFRDFRDMAEYWVSLGKGKHKQVLEAINGAE